MQIAFLGIGLMGRPMCINLLKAGFNLTVWNRTQAKAESLRAYGAEVACSASEAIAAADLIICMLENGPIVEQILFQHTEISDYKPMATIIDMSSIPPEMAKRHACKFSAAGLRYLDAPVSGGTVGAANASLAIMVGGERAVFEASSAVLRALGTPTYIGPAGAGQLAKCANQAIVGITIGAVAEALLLAAEGGADPAAVREALLGGFASSRILELHGQRMLDREFLPGATSRVQLKDLRTILDTAQSENLSLPLSQRVYEQYLELVNKGYEEVDHSGLLLQLESLNSPARLNDAVTTIPLPRRVTEE